MAASHSQASVDGDEACVQAPIIVPSSHCFGIRRASRPPERLPATAPSEGHRQASGDDATGHEGKQRHRGDVSGEQIFMPFSSWKFSIPDSVNLASEMMPSPALKWTCSCELEREQGRVKRMSG